MLPVMPHADRVPVVYLPIPAAHRTLPVLHALVQIRRDIICPVRKLLGSNHAIFKAEIRECIDKFPRHAHGAVGKGKIITSCRHDMYVFHNLFCLLRCISRISGDITERRIDLPALVRRQNPPIHQLQRHICDPPVHNLCCQTATVNAHHNVSAAAIVAYCCNLPCLYLYHFLLCFLRGAQAVRDLHAQGIIWECGAYAPRTKHMITFTVHPRASCAAHRHITTCVRYVIWRLESEKPAAHTSICAAQEARGNILLRKYAFL